MTRHIDRITKVAVMATMAKGVGGIYPVYNHLIPKPLGIQTAQDRNVELPRLRQEFVALGAYAPRSGAITIHAKANGVSVPIVS